MRPLLLSMLLIIGCPILVVAQDNAAFNDLNPHAVNTICPLDGRPVNTSLKPVSLIARDGRTILVGADSQECLNLMQAKFEAYDICDAAKANMTVTAWKAANPTSTAAAAPPSYGSTLSTAPQASPSAFPASETYQPLSPPTTAPAVSASSTEPSPHAHSHHHHAASTASHAGAAADLEYSDERQIAKKAAQRRDGDAEPEGGEAPHHTTHHRTSKKPPAPVHTEEPGSSGTSSFGTTGGTSSFGTTSGTSSFGTTSGTSSFGTSGATTSFGTSAGTTSFGTSGGTTSFGTTGGTSNFGSTAGGTASSGTTFSSTPTTTGTGTTSSFGATAGSTSPPSTTSGSTFTPSSTTTGTTPASP